MLAVEGLRSMPTRPRYLSIESDKTSLDAVQREFELLESLGYSAFKIVPQHDVPLQAPPRPSREGEPSDLALVEG